MKLHFSLFPLALACLLSGCALSHAESVPVDPDLAVGEVLSALQGAGEGDVLEAYGRFERSLEPALRASCGDRSTTALEYRFGQVRAQLQAGEVPNTDGLVQALDEGRRCLIRAARQAQ